ncbi:hypothetical protein VP01_3771g1 [Puccinia sorghi]|uniref:Uncharacterized protein n=1 Tax=Puccinia sorghi TaxID=27349 RepID=A0A0L6UVM0_9BASI|nr:hypothetical protein VP01_3771g1 [Puccinia sorghi]
MMVYNLPMMPGLQLIKGLCKGVLLGNDVGETILIYIQNIIVYMIPLLLGSQSDGHIGKSFQVQYWLTISVLPVITSFYGKALQNWTQNANGIEHQPYEQCCFIGRIKKPLSPTIPCKLFCFIKKKYYSQASPCKLVDLNLLLIYFYVTSQEPSAKSSGDEFPKGCKSFFLVKLFDGSPG